MGLADRMYDERTGRGWQGGGGGRRGGGFGGSGGGPFAAHLTPWVKRLLIANFGVWLVMALGLLPPRLAVDLFGFSTATVLTRPWSPLTYMFVHGGFMHVLFNMLAVFFFGPPLERDMGGTAFIRYYLVCGVGAALTALLLIWLVGAPVVIGASGAVFGVMVAFAWKWPDAPIYVWAVLPVKAKWLVGILGLGALWATMQAGPGGVAHWAHLGGLVTGIVYLKFGDAIAGRWISSRRAGGAAAGGRRGGSSGTRRSKREAQSTDIRSARRRGRAGSDDLDEVDRILDKIREQGIDALSADEQAFLDEMSRKYRSGPDGTA